MWNSKRSWVSLSRVLWISSSKVLFLTAVVTHCPTSLLLGKDLLPVRQIFLKIWIWKFVIGREIYESITTAKDMTSATSSLSCKSKWLYSWKQSGLQSPIYNSTLSCQCTSSSPEWMWAVFISIQASSINYVLDEIIVCPIIDQFSTRWTKCWAVIGNLYHMKHPIQKRNRT